MNINVILFHFCLLFAMVFAPYDSYSQSGDIVQRRFVVTLPDAHVGDLEIDTRLLDSYGSIDENRRQFYLDSRRIFTESEDADFTHPEILKAARKHGVALMGGPMLGNLEESGAVLWLRQSESSPLKVKVTGTDSGNEKSYSAGSVEPGTEQRIIMDGLSSGTDYTYAVYVDDRKVAEGSFRTAPSAPDESEFRVAFGSCFHKIGLHNPNLVNQIVNRKPQVMMLLGDIAVDDRENNIGMHRSDYLLRDVSGAWQMLAANVPLYTSWDDHDYLNNDLSGIPERFTPADLKALRGVWQQNWNNPENEADGIYFSTRTGPVELIMLDTRSCRNVAERGNYASYLGREQQEWLKETLKSSTAPFKIISSGTMWSDYVTNGKDSWGTWDTLARQEIFSLIETQNIAGVLLVSGDRHGARGFTIPGASGYSFYEFEAASLGGVPGPDAMAKVPSNQIFGYHGTEIIAFGEFTFDTRGGEPFVIFRLINEKGTILEEHTLMYSQLTPHN